jgi:nucleoside recognition membrane protein YjiH
VNKAAVFKILTEELAKKAVEEKGVSLKAVEDYFHAVEAAKLDLNAHWVYPREAIIHISLMLYMAYVTARIYVTDEKEKDRLDGAKREAASAADFFITKYRKENEDKDA